jgi:hypothetical protein
MRHRFSLLSLLRPIAFGTAIVIAATTVALAGSLSDRGRYDIERQGLQNGIPLGAKEAAIRQLRSLPLATPPGPWAAIGPQPITNGQGLGTRGFCGKGTTPNVSGRATSITFGGVAGTIYLGTAGGGVWKSIDGGMSWKPLTDQQVSLAIGALAVVPDAGGQDVIYAGTGESNQSQDSNFGLGILKSVDGGQTWTRPPLAVTTFQNQGFARIAVVPGKNTGSDALYAATMRTFINSATSVGDAPPPITAGLFQSTNGGEDWQMLSGKGNLPSGGQVDGAASEVVVNPANSKLVYAGINGKTNGGIWQSVDGGMNWNRVPGMPNRIARVAIAISPDGNTLYAGITTFNAKNEAFLTANFVTNDAGENWQKVALPAVIRTPKKVCLALGQGDYNLAIMSDPSDSKTVYEALIGIYKSTTGGKQWKLISSGSHSDFHALAFNGASLYTANDGGIFVTSNGGATWNSSLNQKLNTIQFQSAVVSGTSTTVVGGTQDNGTDVYTGTPAWTQQMEGDGGIAALARTKTGIAFGEFQFEGAPNEHVARFTVGTTGRSLISPPFTKQDKGQFYTPLILDPSNDDRLLVATNRIWESCSAGAMRRCNATTGTKQPRNRINWRAISPITGKMFAPTPLTGIAIAPTNPAVLYAITHLVEIGGKTQGPFVYVSNNSEAKSPTFTDRSSNLSDAGATTGLTSIAISPIDPATAAVSATGFTGTRGHIFLTQDSGAHWKDLGETSGFPNIPTLAV